MRTPKVRTRQPRSSTIVRPDFLFEKIRHVYFVGEPRSLGIYRPSPIVGNLLCCVLLCAACPCMPHARSSLLSRAGRCCPRCLHHHASLPRYMLLRGQHRSFPQRRAKSGESHHRMRLELLRLLLQ